MKSSHDILIAPWFSEKALIQTERGVYTFAVPKNANKYEIAKAIKEVYSVTPRAVRIVNMPGKSVSMRSRRGVAKRAARRKAYVYLKKGETIQFA
ncbi:MAG: 50S ribosomal protein L23 [bacterium]|nr:50S ribosomal protein L23 [bacterium]